MTIYFSADFHLGHSKIIEYCKRPFATVQDMNKTIIDNWNSKVSKHDEAYFLGDFCWKGYEHLFYQLNGTKHLIIGNHDEGNHAILTLPWASQPTYYKTIQIKENNHTTHRVVLMHYGMRVWDRHRKGSIMLYGHSHNKLPGFQTDKGGGTVDVGVVAWNFFPLTIKDVKDRIATLPFIETENQ